MVTWLINLFLATVILFSIFLFSSKEVFASCAGPFTLSEYKKMADIVLLGKVTGSENNYHRVAVLKYFKGHDVPAQIRVTGKQSSEPGAITSVDFDLEDGKKYLLFLRISRDVFKTSDCVGNREVRDALSEEELKVFGTGNFPSGSTQDLNQQDLNGKANKNIQNNTFLGFSIGAGLLVLLLLLKRFKKI